MDHFRFAAAFDHNQILDRLWLDLSISAQMFHLSLNFTKENAISSKHADFRNPSNPLDPMPPPSLIDKTVRKVS